ncbi:hypothetical protein [Streptomyces sp. NPDC058985]|uniref:hypothetical protein n=1 Tax=Streptomyces sp. NPDC058985 TaxID=3346684 RepID=UPI00368B1F80
MEKSYGIEAARAKLGDIADHTRATGRTVNLTRHGRTVAVIGPVDAVKPSGGVEVTLYFPHAELTRVLPVLPRKGETLVQDVELGPEEETEAHWSVTEVQWHMSANGYTTVGVSLDPVDDHTKELVVRLEAERVAAARAHSAKIHEMRESIRANRPGPVDETPLRDALARQDEVMRANREPADRATET